MGKLVKWIKLPIRTQILLPQAFILSGYYRFRILYVPFEKLAKSLGSSGFETSRETNNEKLEEMKRVKEAVAIVSYHTPWKTECLVQAMTAKRLLNRSGLPCTLYMGVRTDQKTGEMIAHAWLRCGKYIVTGGNGFQEYTVTGVFGDQV